MKNTIKSKDDMVKFIRSLSDSLARNDEEWENRDLKSFLLAMAGWIEDMDGFYINRGVPVPQNIDWDFFSDVLMAARVYE
jgi:hypothetical protein